MKGIESVLNEVKSGIYGSRIQDIYVDEELTGYEKERFKEALLQFRKLFGEKEVELYSAPACPLRQHLKLL